MPIIRFENWLITDEGIRWDGVGNWLIEKEQLAAIRTVDGDKLYEWLIHYAEKADVTEQDIYTLNTAFIFALEYFNTSFHSNPSFVRTTEQQQRIINKKKGKQSDEETIG